MLFLMDFRYSSLQINFTVHFIKICSPFKLGRNVTVVWKDTDLYILFCCVSKIPASFGCKQSKFWIISSHFFNFLSFYSAGSDNIVNPQKRKSDVDESADVSSDKMARIESSVMGKISMSIGKRPGISMNIGGMKKHSVAPIKMSLSTQVYLYL